MMKADVRYDEKVTQEQCCDAIVNALVCYKDELSSDALDMLALLTKTKGRSVRDSFTVFAEALVRYTMKSNDSNQPEFAHRRYMNELYWSLLDGSTIGYIRLLFVTQSVISFATTGLLLAKTLNSVSTYPHHDESLKSLDECIEHVVKGTSELS